MQNFKKGNSYEIILTAEEYEKAIEIGRQRQKSSRKAGTVDRKHIKNPDAVGTPAEVAFGKLFPEAIPRRGHGPDDGVDYTLPNGKVVDVKAVQKKHSQWLVVTNNEHGQKGRIEDVKDATDIWVLMIPMDDSYQSWKAVGWMGREDLHRVMPARDVKPDCPPLGFHRAMLRPMSEMAASAARYADQNRN